MVDTAPRLCYRAGENEQFTPKNTGYLNAEGCTTGHTGTTAYLNAENAETAKDFTT